MPKTPEELRAYRREYMRGYYARNPQKVLASIKAYRLKNPEKVRETKKAYRLANIERMRAKDRAYIAEHREERRQWRIENRDKLHTYDAVYRATHKNERQARDTANPDRVQAAVAKRRARKKAAVVNDFTLVQWREMKDHYDQRCVYCGKKQQRLTQDHITPLSQGGFHTRSNIVPACKSCNSKKHVGPPLKPIQPLLL